MLVEQVKALKSIQETYVAMNGGQLNEGLSKEQLLAIKKHYSNHDHIMADVGDYEYYKKHNDNKSAESIAKKLKSIAIDDKVILDEKFAHSNHKKLDANGNGKLDAQDFAMLRAKKKGIKNFKEFKEEVEQLDELSKKTLGSYIKHANIDSNDRAQFIGTEPGALKAIRKREKGISTAVNKLTKEDIEGLDEGTNIPVSRATDAVSKVMGQKGAVNFLAKLKPGNKTHTSWNEVNSALVDQGAQSAHIAKVAGHLKPTQYNEAED